MIKYYRLIAVLVLFVVIFFGYFYHKKSKNFEKNQADELTFTNTAEWDPALSAKATQIPRFIPYFEDRIALPPFPVNSSIETKNEIEALLVYQKNLTEGQVSVIKDQRTTATLVFGGKIIDMYLSPEFYPKTGPLLAAALKDLDIVVYHEKSKFNRVRPHKLDPRVKPVIDVPPHPAYPSGHSTQAHFLALFLGELRPADKDKLWAEADEVALNRERAGVHYPSDSIAGALLAKQAFALMMENPEFKKLFESARSEWN